MNIMKVATILLAFIFAISVIFVIFFISIEAFSFNLNFYNDEYEKLGVPQSIGTTKQELIKSTGVLLDYIKDKRDDLIVTAEIQGTERNVFNEREILHMVDVKALFLSAIRIKTICIAATIISLLGLITLLKTKALRFVATVFLISVGVFSTTLLILGIYAYIDFDTFWTKFHHVFFSNDLWLLDPDTDILIQMVPLEFFYDLVIRIISLFFGSMIVLALASIYIITGRLRQVKNGRSIEKNSIT